MVLPLLAVAGIGAVLGAGIGAAAGPKEIPLWQRALGGGLAGAFAGGTVGAGLGLGAAGAGTAAPAVAPVVGGTLAEGAVASTPALSAFGSTGALAPISTAGTPTAVGGFGVPTLAETAVNVTTPTAGAFTAPTAATEVAATGGYSLPTFTEGATAAGKWAGNHKMLGLAGATAIAGMEDARSNAKKAKKDEKFTPSDWDSEMGGKDASWAGRTYRGREAATKDVAVGMEGVFSASVARARAEEEKKRFNPRNNGGAGYQKFFRPPSYTGRG
jgi:hypothetical protein